MHYSFDARKKEPTTPEAIALEQVSKLNAENILNIPENEPAGLFAIHTAEYIKSAYRKLAVIWHPDKNASPKASEVFVRINRLEENAQLALKSGLWLQANTLHITTVNDTQLSIPFIKAADFELGKFFLTKHSIVYLVSNAAEDLFNNAVQTIQGLKYPDAVTASGIGKYLPEIKGIHATNDFKILILKKDPQLVLLRDVLNLPEHSGKLDPFHVAWMLSRLHNFACYFKWAGISHQAISLDTCFIDPAGHDLAILGGWWYCQPINQPLLSMPGSLTKFVPTVINSGLTQANTDLSLTRALCLQLLGNTAGCGYFVNPAAPPSMLQWLQQPNANDAYTQYAKWKDEIRVQLFPDKKGLIAMPVDVRRVYPRLV
jgi:hypothetical protein